MNKTFHVLSPVSRPQYWNQIRDCLRDQDVIWHPIAHLDRHLEALPEADWILPSFFNAWGTNDACYMKLNWWIRHKEIEDNAMYHFLCDDSLVEHDFYEKLRMEDADVQVVMALRGDHYTSEYGNALVPCPQNMRYMGVTLEQLVVSGRILRNWQFDLEFGQPRGTGADGHFAMHLLHVYPDKISYRPDCVVKFNALEPGRYKFHTPYF